MAAYSPKLNLVEYAIHLIRQSVLHQADYTTGLAGFERQIKERCKKGKAVDKNQIVNTLEHTESLVPDL